MVTLFRKRKPKSVEFCDRCGCVCDSTCRAKGVLSQARDQALAAGIRLT
jgi:hypothetical protein